MMNGKNLSVAINERINHAETQSPDRGFAYQLLISDLERELARVQRWARDKRPEPCQCASHLEQWESTRERLLSSLRENLPDRELVNE